MSNNGVSGYGLDQLNLIVCLKICHLLLDLSDHFEVVHRKDQLHIDVDLVGYFPRSISDQ